MDVNKKNNNNIFLQLDLINKFNLEKLHLFNSFLIYLINLIEEIYYCCFFVYIHKIQIFEFFIEKTFLYVKINLNQN